MSSYEPLDRGEMASTFLQEIQSLRDALDGIGFDADDQELLAYLRATNFCRDQACERLAASAAWKKDVEIKDKLQNASWLEEERAMRHVLLYDYIGLDRHGRPVLVERIGAWNVEAVLEATEDLEKFKMLHSMADEILLEMERPAEAKDSRGFVLILDMDGLSAWHLRPGLISAFAAVSKIDEAHYPDTVAHVFVVNAPWIFQAVFAMIRPFLNKDTLTKIHFSTGATQLH
mmetsp:Transcript_38590/g.89294  ORF Transcript_38590/g.89294 Transcript_38590/m.89294 type:complete len:231 (-) Transcript_38590:221-913(-)